MIAELKIRNIVAVPALVSLRQGNEESQCRDLRSISVGPQPSSNRWKKTRRGSGRTKRIYVFREGQGNEGSDKCSGQAENSWMQRGEKARRGKGKMGGENAKGWMHLHVTRTLSRQIPFSGSFPTRGWDEDCFRTGHPRHPGFEKAMIAGTQNPWIRQILYQRCRICRR